MTLDTSRGPRYDDDLRLAHVIADQVDAVAMEAFTTKAFEVQEKPDQTPVTDADLRCEEIIRNQLKRTRPRDAISGEEYGVTGDASRRWVVDPIDGTKNFARGVPIWGTLLALVVDEVPVLGVVSAPALNRRWWGVQGFGAYTGRSLSQATRINVSKVSDIRHATTSITDIASWEKRGQAPAYLSLTRRTWNNRALGDFWSYMLVAEGAIDVAADPALAPHDMAALVPIIEEAGGTFTSLRGKPGPWHGSALATNTILHDQVRRLLNA